MEYIDIATKEQTMSANNLTITENMEKIYDAGKKSQYDEFWDAFQHNGNLSVYSYVFSYGKFDKDTFKPKYPIQPTKADFMFAYSTASRVHNPQNMITDLAGLVRDNNIIFDTSRATNLNNMFYATDFTSIPTISFESITNKIESVCNNSGYITTIEKVIFKADGSNTLAQNDYDAPFMNMTSLKNIEVEGVIGDTLKIKSSSSLTKESAISIITHLKNYKGTANEGVKSVIFHNNVWNRLDDDAGEPTTGLSWIDYVESIGWNS